MDKEDTYSHSSSREEHKSKKRYAFHGLAILDCFSGNRKVNLTISLLNKVIQLEKHQR